MKRLCIIAASLTLASLAGCNPEAADGPPEVRLGDSVCDQCNMIISAPRWAPATIVRGPRGPEARLFDDFNCQVNYEVEHPDQKIITRWSRSYTDSAWIRTRDACFLASPELRTPMASGHAAFATRAQAEAARSEINGDVVDFAVAWKRLGFAGACCHGEDGGTKEGK